MRPLLQLNSLPALNTTAWSSALLNQNPKPTNPATVEDSTVIVVEVGMANIVEVIAAIAVEVVAVAEGITKILSRILKGSQLAAFFLSL